jgi:hypothetical protein
VRREIFLVSAAVALIAPAGLVGSRAAAQTSACGVERWTVKTLQDRPIVLPLQAVTIAYLVSRPHPSVLPAARLPFERHVFRVTAAVTLVRPEEDGDLHLVLSDGARTMIAESLRLCARLARLRRGEVRWHRRVRASGSAAGRA